MHAGKGSRSSHTVPQIPLEAVYHIPPLRVRCLPRGCPCWLVSVGSYTSTSRTCASDAEALRAARARSMLKENGEYPPWCTAVWIPLMRTMALQSTAAKCKRMLQRSGHLHDAGSENCRRYRMWLSPAAALPKANPLNLDSTGNGTRTCRCNGVPGGIPTRTSCHSHHPFNVTHPSRCSCGRGYSACGTVLSLRCCCPYVWSSATAWLLPCAWAVLRS